MTNNHQEKEEQNLNTDSTNESTPTEPTEIEKVDQQETTINEKDLEKKKGLVVTDIIKLIWSLKDYLAHILNLKEGADIPGTVEGIKKDIDFTGHKAWILILSIFIASIGLNVNSTAVIIGAMLISPLMGPILGAGLAVGINDPETFSRSLRNLATAVGISLAASTLYFLISPFDTPESELIARTKPTILDIAIAFFGGAAGIIAGSRSEKSNVVPGVAIATALMPPLCTAGFGLANWNMEFFLGAFYLFLLNSIFIWLATYLVVRLINFPRVKFIDPEREKKYRKYIIISIVAIILPAFYIFWTVLQERIFESRANSFITENIQFKNTVLSSFQLTFEDEEKNINLILVGKPLSKDRIQELKMLLPNYGLEDVSLTIAQNEEIKPTNDSEFQIAIYKSKEEQIFVQDSIIKALQGKISEYLSDTIPLTNLEKEIKVLHPSINRFSYAPFIESDMQGVRDTIPTFLVIWDPSADLSTRATETDQLEKWLKARLNDNAIHVISY